MARTTRTSRSLARKLPFLDQKHPAFLANLQLWLKNEKRLAGGDDILDELRPFDWEKKRGPRSHYAFRQGQAIYVNFPDIVATEITGHLLRFAPKPGSGLDFGELGQVRLDRDAATETQAELIYDSVDAPNRHGNSWDQFWFDAQRRAMATGHRWIMCESPGTAPANEEEEGDNHPYLAEISPIDAPMWFYNRRNELEFMIMRPGSMNPQMDNDDLDLREGFDYLLLVAEGCKRLGPKYEGGGWWLYNPDKDLYPDGHETWDDTLGEIPVWPLFYRRFRGAKGGRKAISQPGLTELGQAAIAFMNLDSAATFDAWDSAKSIDWLCGVDEDAMDIVDEKMKAGSRYIPLLPNQDTDQNPTVQSGAAGAVPAETFDKRLDRIRMAAELLGIREITGGGGSTQGSGSAQNTQFSAKQLPRIVLSATNLGLAQTKGIRFFQLRFGHDDPSGGVNWTTKIELQPLVDRIKSFFETERLSGIRSETLDSKLMVLAAKEGGFIEKDEDEESIKGEYVESAKRRVETEIAANSEMQDKNMKDPNKEGLKDKSREAAKKVDGDPKQNPGGRRNRR